ncbi:hypothetical protein AB204_00510 [Xenorhabdus khoisanae]|uniref:Uncharacterized protein n=1 Tax=Xenorhabdus khoisanae TaxID=880157 RepID=A0A0J5FYN1_9GAMM|nr:hypothetical protein [Xenorhabdus khoisanae]KMJ47012.1 hypothetical protein AB204_00510 [Xenorhabdus khoisanae]
MYSLKQKEEKKNHSPRPTQNTVNGDHAITPRIAELRKNFQQLNSQTVRPRVAPRPLHSLSKTGPFQQATKAPIASEIITPVSAATKTFTSNTQNPKVTPTSTSAPTNGVKKSFTLYRADNRSFEELQKSSPEGFKAWVHLDSEKARKFASVFLGNDNVESLPKHIIDEINKWKKGGTPKLSDLSTFIKYTKDRSTVWVSTAVNTEAGGQSSGAPLYEISMELYEFGVDKGKLVPLPNGRTGNMKPSIHLDTQNLADATIIALNHGPVNDAEMSFLTTIPMSNLKPYRR